jgi:hypothetical protein
MRSPASSWALGSTTLPPAWTGCVRARERAHLDRSDIRRRPSRPATLPPRAGRCSSARASATRRVVASGSRAEDSRPPEGSFDHRARRRHRTARTIGWMVGPDIPPEGRVIQSAFATTVSGAGSEACCRYGSNIASANGSASVSSGPSTSDSTFSVWRSGGIITLVSSVQSRVLVSSSGRATPRPWVVASPSRRDSSRRR